MAGLGAKLRLVVVASCLEQSALCETQFFPSDGTIAKQAVVFVHGLTGDSNETWKNPGTNFFWPKALQRDKDFREYDIVSIHYESSCSSGFTPFEAAQSMAEELKGLQERTRRVYDKLIFVAHSFGGLVVMEALLEGKIDPSKTKMLVMFGTPLLGSSLGALGNLFCKNPQFRSLSAKRGNYLDSLTDRWRNKYFGWFKTSGFGLFSGYEVLAEPIVGMVVEKESATYFSQAAHAFNKTHTGLVKPTGEKDSVYIWLKKLISGENFALNKDENSQNETMLLFAKLNQKLMASDYQQIVDSIESGNKLDKVKFMNMMSASAVADNANLRNDILELARGRGQQVVRRQFPKGLQIGNPTYEIENWSELLNFAEENKQNLPANSVIGLEKAKQNLLVDLQNVTKVFETSDGGTFIQMQEVLEP